MERQEGRCLHVQRKLSLNLGGEGGVENHQKNFGLWDLKRKESTLSYIPKKYYKQGEERSP